MGIVDLTEVRGYRFVDEVVCENCITEDEKKELTEEDFLTERDLENEEKAYFCDRKGPKCKGRL